MSNLNESQALDSGNTAIVLAGSCMAMLMTPAFGIFHSGLVRRKNILHMIIQCYSIFAVSALIWGLFGYSLTFGISKKNFIGTSKHLGFRNIDNKIYSTDHTIPTIAFFIFHLSACSLAPSLIVDSTAERLGFFPSLLFSCFWIILVYCPTTYWIINKDGWLNRIGAKDFAGGIFIHMSAGCSSVAMALITGKRKIPKDSSDKFAPHNVTYVVLGSSLLWFGWLGYNAAATLGGNGHASLAVFNTNLAAATGTFGWILMDYIITKKLTATGIALGSVNGLVSMTAGCGICSPWSPILISTIGSVFSRLVIKMKDKHRIFDDALNIFAYHGISGAWGAFILGLFANDEFAQMNPNNIYGGFYGHGSLIGCQFIAILSVAAYSFVVTALLAFIMKLLKILRVSETDEEVGLDKQIYKEEAYVIHAEIPYHQN